LPVVVKSRAVTRAPQIEPVKAGAKPAFFLDESESE